MAGAPSNEKDKVEGGEKKKAFRPFSKKQGEEKVLAKLPTLKYGKGNNFVKFKTALLEVALEEYGDLGRLIRLEKYCIPVFVVPDYSGAGFPRQRKGLRMEAMKTHQRKVKKMVDSRPKLFGLILRPTSPESKDEVAQDPDYDIWSEATDPEKL